MRASFCSPCPARLEFSLFFPVFSLAAGHHSSFSSPVPRPPRIFSLLPCFFSGGGAPQLSFFSCAPPTSDFLSSSLFFLWWRGTTALFLLPCPALPKFPLFFPAFSLVAGHHSSLSSPMPSPPQIFSLLPCFFSGGGAPQLFFFSCAPPRTAARPAVPILTKTATAKPLCEIRRLCRRRTL